ALFWAGGQTDEDHRAAHLEEMVDRYGGNLLHEDALTARNQALRGRKYSAAERERRRHRAKEHASTHLGLAKLIASSRTVEGRVRRALMPRLRHEPRPTPAIVRGWAEAVGRERELPAEAVEAIWSSVLRKRG